MSEIAEALEDYEGVPEEPKAVTGSLEERVAERRRALESRTTELFEVPGFEGVFKAELQIVGGKRQHAIAKKHERVHDEYQMLLRVAGDLLLAATVAIHSVVNDESDETALAEGVTWKRLAQAYDKQMGDDVPARAALVRLLGEANLIELVSEWRNWMRTRGATLTRQLAEDF